MILELCADKYPYLIFFQRVFFSNIQFIEHIHTLLTPAIPCSSKNLSISTPDGGPDDVAAACSRNTRPLADFSAS